MIKRSAGISLHILPKFREFSVKIVSDLDESFEGTRLTSISQFSSNEAHGCSKESAKFEYCWLKQVFTIYYATIIHVLIMDVNFQLDNLAEQP